MANKKKIFDILPPTPDIKEEQEEVFYPVKKDISFSSFRKLNRKPVLIVFLVVLLFVLSYIVIEPEAEIIIWPQKELREFRTETTLTGEVFKTEKSVSEEFPSTGKKTKSTKAQGTIRVYNAYSTYSQPLVATTRFVSDNGKLFRTPEKVVVPGGQYEEGKLVPGSIDIKVVADQPGQDYNIGPSTFSIPGFVGTAKYTAFYAKSFEPMSGGWQAEVIEVSSQDLEKAQAVVTKKALEESKTVLKESIPIKDYLLLEEAIEQKISEITPLAKAGQEVEKFLFQVKVEAAILAFPRRELEDLAKNYIKSQLPPGKELKEKGLLINYFVKSFDFTGKKAILGLEISAEVYSTLDKNLIKETIRNKKVQEVMPALRKFPEIEMVKVNLSPFWARRTPEDLEKIEIKLNLD